MLRYLSWIALVAAALSGCSGSMPFDLAPVRGKVTYDDGSPIKAASILVTFTPIVAEGGGAIAPPGGQVTVGSSDGTFDSVSSHRPGDGLVVGRHKVVVVSFESGPDGRPHRSEAVPERYTKIATTPLEIEIPPEGNDALHLKIQRK
jgi:hypothetical protein